MKAQSFAKFYAKYIVVKNPHDTMAGIDGCLFGTSAEEWDAIKKQNPQHVWTVVECGNHWYIATGFHLVNRIGFLLTEQPWKREEEDKVYLYD